MVNLGCVSAAKAITEDTGHNVCSPHVLSFLVCTSTRLLCGCSSYSEAAVQTSHLWLENSIFLIKNNNNKKPLNDPSNSA